MRGRIRGGRLEQWAATIRELARQVESTFVYFNNDQNGYAPRNALTLMELLSDTGAVIPPSHPEPVEG